LDYYNKKYFDWQKDIGKLGGEENLFKFNEFVQKDSKVIDFGSGGGYLLSNLKCKDKVGIEINQIARDTANKAGIKTFKTVDEVEDNWADLIISDHALEHVTNPLSVLQALFYKLKENGKIVFVVPTEKKNRYKPNDVNFHLYSWSEMNLGNIFVLAGFEVLQVKEIKHRWPPGFTLIKKTVGHRIFDIICRLYGHLRPNISQIRIVAQRKLKIDHAG